MNINQERKTLRRTGCRALALLIALSPLARPALCDKAADAKEHWAFQPIRNPAPPAVRKTAWCQNSIDPFILAQLEKAGLEPAAPADRRTLIRRATYDLTGLPPKFEDVQAFVADQFPDAFEKVIDRLLSSPAYGEKWGRHWLDVVRYADTAGETADYPVPVAWRYRNYVIQAFNNDKPYNEFIREQVAGDILARHGPREKYAERVTATGFIALSRRFGYDSENYHHLTIQDTLDTLGQSVLGLSIGCARCHDHKFDPIPNDDYYALYGIFESTRYAFPGSEQKQRLRALVPLEPVEEAEPKWRKFDARVALLRERLAEAQKPTPAALIRSLDENDGDFEIQAPAAGGSRGVLVPPWVSSGEVSVTAEAQSPFNNLYAGGKSGVTMGATSNAIATFFQSVYPRRSAGSAEKVYLNLDFKIELNAESESGIRHFIIGSRSADGKESAALDLIFSADHIAMASGNSQTFLAAVKTNEWQNLQLILDLRSGSFRGIVETRERTSTFQQPLLPDWNGVLDYVGISTSASPKAVAPKISFDNFGVQTHPIATLAETAPREHESQHIEKPLRDLVGMDGDLEFQTAGLQPSEPWRPGPNSKVKIGREAQSPFQNIYAKGELGIVMENSGSYDGVIQKLANSWKAGKTNETLYVSFDFQCASEKLGSAGSWRFYLGEGAGSSAAIELFITGHEFYGRNGEEIQRIAEIHPNQWHQVQIELDLKEKSYRGSIGTGDSVSNFSGKCAPAWSGIVDHLFIDSYGHIGGTRPALWIDNFAVNEKPFPARDSAPVVVPEDDLADKRRKLDSLRAELAETRRQADAARKELESLLTEGPVDLAYGVVEGTPQDVPIQMRGEPDRPGKIVHRGFLSALAFVPARRLSGSGRLELADWLVDPRNPLTPRVMANRIWKYHFGRGIVETPNDFGMRGRHPTHPELLDYLAEYFMKSGWSIKAMHRLIMLSAAYQQSCPEGNDLVAAKLYRGVARRRLTAEELRDSILLASGELDRKPGTAHPFPPPYTWGFSQHAPFTAVYNDNKRSVYQMQQRIKHHPFLALFDCADPNSSVPERRTTTVPTQALFFLNDAFIHGKSEALARKIVASCSNAESRVNMAWKAALSREPSAIERAEALQFIAAYEAESLNAKVANPTESAFAALARTLFGSNEFLHID